MLVQPRQLFLYWVLDGALRSELARAAGPASLRLEISADGRSYHEVSRRPFDFRAPSWYLENSNLDCLARVRLGIEAAGGGLREILVSNTLRVPRESAGAGAETWKEAAELRRFPAPRAEPSPREAGRSSAGHRDEHAPTSPGPLAWGSPPARRAPRAGGGPSAEGYMCFVLHSHLPFVRHPERREFLEERWLFEAITETYLPLLDAFKHLAEERLPVRVTISLTPTLMAMLRDPLLMEKYDAHLEKMCELARREVVRTRRDPAFGPAAGFYCDRLERYRYLFRAAYGGDLVGEFGRLEAQGFLEIIGCAATHALLPNLAVDRGAVRAQIAVGVAEHRRQLHRPPRGMWLPECAYFEGLDELLAEAGIDYFFVDSHAVRGASSAPRFDLHAPLYCPSGVAAFPRDEECSVQVWSAELGYPGDPTYRDFYRDIGFDLDLEYLRPYLDPSGLRSMTGFKYHRITGRTDHKEPYRRDAALRTVARHAADFAGNRARQVRRLASRMDRPPLLVAMYDAELFGHWWFEGPEWIEAVLRRLPKQHLRALTPSDYLAEHPAGQVAEPAASSWGEKGYYEVWLSGTNDWIVPPLHDAARRMKQLAARDGRAAPLERRALAQAGRELLLAQASDWPFILRNRTTERYARRRISEHLARFDALARQVEEGRPDEKYLAAVEAQDNVFPELDAGVWRSA